MAMNPEVPANSAISASQTLVKYDNPVLLSKLEETRLRGGKKAVGAPADAKAQQTEDILAAILPPREFSAEGQMWVQKVSSTPATRLDVINLQEQLDLRLKQRKARETGICPVRRELYDQAFDELIRQVTINTAERGLLLLRVRDEIRMAMQGYQTLYESSVAFGLRNSIQADQGKTEMQKKIATLEGREADLSRQVAELKAALELRDKKEVERRSNDDKKHQQEIAFHKQTIARLKAQLESQLIK